MTEEETLIKSEAYMEMRLRAKSALKILETQLDILKDEFALKNSYNPVEHIVSRIKTDESIIEKVKRRHFDMTVEDIIKKLNDIVGIRIVCSFINDVYTLVDIIRSSDSIEVIEEKDYITTPKDTGYASYHLIVRVPVPLIKETVYVKAEIQIRTLAMDFWANVDHKLQYKCIGKNGDDFGNELISCSKIIRDLDDEMGRLIKKINELSC